MNNQEWLLENDIHLIAELEEGVSVTAGSLDIDAFYRRVERQLASAQSDGSSPASVLAFSKFLNLARRERGLTIEQLAEQIDADALEVLQIEEGTKMPEPRIVANLAKALRVLPGRLMQLAGHVDADKQVVSAAYAFATRSNSKPLEPEERDALNEFVKALGSE